MTNLQAWGAPSGDEGDLSLFELIGRPDLQAQGPELLRIGRLRRAAYARKVHTHKESAVTLELRHLGLAPPPGTFKK